MKRSFLLLLFLNSLSFHARAQYVNIPDAGFRTFLETYYPACMNSGMLDTTCSEVLNASDLYIARYNGLMYNLEGLQYFKNLTGFSCTYNEVTRLPAPLPRHLKQLLIYKNKINELPALPDSLTNLECWENRIDSMPALPLTLGTLVCDNNPLGKLPELPNSITTLSCRGTLLSEIPALPPQLAGLFCSNNQLTELPVLPPTLTNLEAYVNQLAVLPALPPQLSDLNIGVNNLTYIPAIPNSVRTINIAKNQLSSLPGMPSGLQILNCSGNPLSCLPPLPYGSMSELYTKGTAITCWPNALKPGIYTDTILPVCSDISKICDVNPAAKGLVFNDANQNNKYDNGESLLSEQLVSVVPGDWVGGTNTHGAYLVKLDTGITNTWSCTTTFPYSTVFPESYSYNPHNLKLIDSSFNFAVHVLPNVRDLAIALTGSPVRPGFTATITMTATNDGTIGQDHIRIKLKKPEGFDVLETTPGISYTSGDTLFWENVSLEMGQRIPLNIELQVPVSAPLDSTVIFEAWIGGPAGDSTPANNHIAWSEVIRGSYDPNDKSVRPEVLAPDYKTSDRLLYTIRFQNTGTDTAFQVVIRDTLPEQLDVRTLKVVNASHPYRLSIREKHVVEVYFSNILLPDSTINEPGSHGFVQLSLQPKAGLLPNTTIGNDAFIYFDFNVPIKTNTAQTRISITTGTVHNNQLSFKLFPNPASDLIRVELPYAATGYWRLSSSNGSILKNGKLPDASGTFSVRTDDLPCGSYFLTIDRGGLVSTSRVIIIH